jgi:predicted nucleic acid-binding protein
LTLLLDTSVAILLRDGDREIEERLSGRPGDSLLSVVSRVELEGGVYRDPTQTQARRRRLDQMLSELNTLPFRVEEAQAFGAIVARSGFSRPRILDRMIAATALVADATLVTNNPRDFADIAGLKMEAW